MEMTLGKRIVQQRKKLGLTQEQLAEKLGVTAQAVSKWENDQSCPDISILPRLADIFGVTTDALLGRESERPVYQAEVVREDDDDTILHMTKDGWDFRVYGSRKGALGLAFLVLAVGAQLLVAKLVDCDITFWKALWPTSLIVFGLTVAVSKFSFLALGSILFGCYFLLDYWGALPFQLEGGVIFPAVLVILGLSLLVDALKKPKKPKVQISRNGQVQNSLKLDADTFEYHAAFGEGRERICLPVLRAGKIHTSCGEYTVDLSGVQSVSPECGIEAHCAFGELRILVPGRFRVEKQPSAFLASVEVNGQPDEAPSGTILIEANAGFGEISVNYI